MKKNSLTTAIIAGVAGVAGLAGVAHAVNLNPDGIGQVLLYPYYTTNGGNSTLISVVNTADVGKAVKVRFLESLNSKEVLDFNLYLSPFDVWTANVHENEDGVPGIRTSDKSCIAPVEVMTEFTEFRGFEFTNWRPDLLGRTAAAAEQNASRMRQGHLEIIEMGDLVGSAHDNALHGMYDGEWKPRNCGWFHAQWFTYAPNTWLTETGGRHDTGTNDGKGLHSVCAPGAGFVNEAGVPECGAVGGVGGIFGSAYIVNGAEGTSYSYNAEAINGFYTISDVTTGVATDKNLHHQPGSVFPRLDQATTHYDTGVYYATATVFDAAGTAYPVAFERTDSPEAVSAVLMSRYIANEYAINGFTSAASDWVVTFPTKMLHTYRSPVGSTTVAGLAPFTEAQGSGSLNNRGDNEFDGYWAERYSLMYWDREEGEPGTPPTVGSVSPLPPPGEEQVLAFGAEANVLTFFEEGTDAVGVLAAPAGTMGGGYTVELESGFQVGWARVGFETQSMSSSAQSVGGVAYPATTLNGLPVIGFWAAKHTNHAAAEGVSAFYNIIHRHRAVRDISLSTTAP